MKQKNMTLELIKLLASYMVVFIHVPFTGAFGDAMNALARFAVPLFFIISGFYSYDISLETIKKRMKNMLFLLVLAVTAHIVFDVLALLYQGNAGQIGAYFRQYIVLSDVIKLFVFNVPACSAHLWYLFAALYIYIILYIATWLKLPKKLTYAVSFALLALQLLLGEGMTVLGKAVPVLMVRNFVMMGIPFFGMGLFIKEHAEKLRDLSVGIAVGAVVIGAAEVLVSRFAFGSNEVYLGSLLVVFGLVVIFIRYDRVAFPKLLVSLTGCSTYIYIFHKLISKVMLELYDLCRIPYAGTLLENVHPILVCAVSTGLALVILKIQRSLRAGKEKAKLTV